MADASAARLLIGPFFLGSLFSYGLYGVLSLQVYTYYQAYPKDNTALKTTVGVLFFLDTVITVISTILGWHALVTEWGSEHAFTPYNWSLAPLPLLSCIVAVIVQGFYSWRIYKLRANTPRTSTNPGPHVPRNVPPCRPSIDQLPAPIIPTPPRCLKFLYTSSLTLFCSTAYVLESGAHANEIPFPNDLFRHARAA